MLSDEDKKDVIDNKANYTVEDIEEKLSVICFRKKVNFELEDNSKNDIKIEQPAVTFNMSNLGASKPDWLIAVDNAKGVTQYGGTIAAPIAKNILTDAIYWEQNRRY